MFWEPQVQDTYSPLTSEFSEFCLRKPQCSTEGGGKLSELLAAQLRPILCDPMDCSPPGSSVHRILQARIFKWVAMPSSREAPSKHTKLTSCEESSCFFFFLIDLLNCFICSPIFRNSKKAKKKKKKICWKTYSKDKKFSCRPTHNPLRICKVGSLQWDNTAFAI